MVSRAFGIMTSCGHLTLRGHGFETIRTQLEHRACHPNIFLRLFPHHPRLPIRSGNLIFRTVEDADLIARARKGDVEAFNHLVSRWEKRVYNYLLRLTSRSEDSMDLAQDVFLKAWQNIRKLDDATIAARSALQGLEYRIEVDDYASPFDTSGD